MIGKIRSILFVSVFEGSLAVAIIMIDGSENPIVSWALNFRVRMLLKTAIRSAHTKRGCQQWETQLQKYLKVRMFIWLTFDLKEKLTLNRV